MLLPIVRHHEPTIDAARLARADALAMRLLREQPELCMKEALRPLAAHAFDAPTLHLDDLTGIPLIDRDHDVTYLEDRARLRAADGDLVATCAPATPGFEEYFAERLGLGSVSWLHPERRGDPKAVAASCWADRDVRRALVGGLRRGQYRNIHPHIGNHAVWALAVLLRKASGRRVAVIAPHPALTAAVNDKNWFADVVERLLGFAYVPRTYRAYTPAGLVHVLRFLAQRAPQLVIKVPDSAGGAGTLLIAAEEVRGASSGELRIRLRQLLAPLRWIAGDALLVSNWETGAVTPISCQLWIPPEHQGLPIVEGTFLQLIEDEVRFLGARSFNLRSELSRELVENAWLLGYLFQRLGYVGRCSFDAIVVERNAQRRLEFIECNGRWGGTSSPMTLMNRLFGDFAVRPYAARRVQAAGLERLAFRELLEHFSDRLYDARTRRGRFILYSPAALQIVSGIDAIALGNESGDADAALSELMAELRDLAAAARSAGSTAPRASA